MRPQLPLSTAAAVVCAALALGTAGPAAAATHPSHDGGRTATTARAGTAHAPRQDSDTLAARLETLKRLGGMLTPVNGLLDATAKAPGGRLPAAEATRLAAAAQRAIAAARPAGAKGSPAAGTRALAPADSISDALDALSKAVDALVAGAEAGDTADTQQALGDAITHTVDVIVANIMGGLSASGVTGLPATSLPALPGADDPASTLPAATDPASTLPAATGPEGISTLPTFAHPGLTDPTALMN
ncbi:hypothetical protein [Streptomyces fuscigenes]|uniref:hypothetical protein n=1 Tax=Streptomyces fuscigenes TaxID=1528880 RepID=UPI001F1B4A63|nr:hypothetical protein [Streptomyces fuscigenes]MCF3964278.1 hypothetical protein [Streptomyces fuscigenes]